MNVHFVGIGGIGVSALARYYLKKGWRVTGSDGTRSEITDALKREGVRVFIGEHKREHLSSSANLVVYSPAVHADNPELCRAEELKQAGGRVDILSYPEALGELTKTHYTIAVAGTHGKSTTTAMLGLLLTKAGLDPTVIVGTMLKEFGFSNFRAGGGKKLVRGMPLLVLEADEHFASFLHYSPSMIVLTSIEADHLDYYKNLSNVVRTFGRFISRLPGDGCLVCNGEDENTRRMMSKVQCKIQEYSINKQKEGEMLRKILKVPGEHNVANALAALTAARELGVGDEVSFKSLGMYKGAWRRFEIFRVSKPKPYTLVSDYGHHPTEVGVTADAARKKWPKKTIWLVFQPHQYQRTHLLFKDFTRVLANLPVDRQKPSPPRSSERSPRIPWCTYRHTKMLSGIFRARYAGARL
ncbi:MAG: UDP-N-acetylmuramate--L-alanine ligase [Candidatus Wildermuthbacteria bacterium]|nr:UDP-N-acetylmuramate--L-alanine ligase [Candidatus Wildermuthbacteria bacterium]